MNEENDHRLSLLSENTSSFFQRTHSLHTVRTEGTRLIPNMRDLGRSMMFCYLALMRWFNCGQKLRGSIQSQSTGSRIRLVAYQSNVANIKYRSIRLGSQSRQSFIASYRNLSIYKQPLSLLPTSSFPA